MTPNASPLPSRPQLLAASLLSLAGMVFFHAWLASLWHDWTTDPLRSIGLLIPPTVLLLAWRNARRCDWNQGSWWGFGLMLLCVLLALNRGPRPILDWQPYLGWLGYLPTSLLFPLYWLGAVLLFGGRDGARALRFPLLLLLLLMPMPPVLTALIDLPLQTLAAQGARLFAGWLGVPVSGDALKLMFSPELGIFLAPGCNGLRGALTMGYLALVIGYLYRLPLRGHVLYVIGAVALAYLFNFVRLFGVIAYYWLALRIPAISHYGTEIDYVIGGVLFFCAALFLFNAPRRRNAQ